MANKLETGSIAKAVMSRWYSNVFNVPTIQSSLSLSSSEKSLRPVRPKFLRENMVGVTSRLYVRAFVSWIRTCTVLSRSVWNGHDGEAIIRVFVIQDRRVAERVSSNLQLRRFISDGHHIKIVRSL